MVRQKHNPSYVLFQAPQTSAPPTSTPPASAASQAPAATESA